MSQTLKIRWTEEEERDVVLKMVELARLDPDLAEGEIFRRAYHAALSQDRHPKVITPIRRHRYVHLIYQMYEILNGGMTESPPEEAASPEMEAEAVPVEEQPSRDTPNPRELAHELVDRLFGREERDRAAEEEIQALKRDLSAMSEVVTRTSQQVAEFHSMLGRILGDLAGYATPKDELPIQPPEPHVPPCLAPRHSTTPTPPDRTAVPKIGLIGPMPRQAANIRVRVGDGATIKYHDKEKHTDMSIFADCDWVVISRHARHELIYAAHQAVGRHRVVMVPTGGMDTIVAKIRELAATTTSRMAKAGTNGRLEHPITSGH